MQLEKSAYLNLLQRLKQVECFEKFDPLSFRNDLAMAPWYLVAAESDPNKSWGIWKQIFEYIADSHAPLKKKRVREILSLGLHYLVVLSKTCC